MNKAIAMAGERQVTGQLASWTDQGGSAAQTTRLPELLNECNRLFSTIDITEPC